MWYFIYDVIFYDETIGNSEKAAGLLYAGDFVEAIKDLVEYYGNELEEINLLTPLNDNDGPVLDFIFAKDDTRFTRYFKPVEDN